MKATDRQLEVYRFIEEFKGKFGYMPSTRDIRDKFGFRSQTGAINHLKALESKGYISRVPNRARAIRLLREIPKTPL